MFCAVQYFQHRLLQPQRQAAQGFVVDELSIDPQGRLCRVVEHALFDAVHHRHVGGGQQPGHRRPIEAMLEGQRLQRIESEQGLLDSVSVHRRPVIEAGVIPG
ncbi:hypothetical protein D3C84_685480 [compost metagenome]